MNKARRAKVATIYATMQGCLDDLQNILEEEETARDNLPENLQESEQWCAMDEACDSLYEATDHLGSAMDSLDLVL